MIDFSFASDRLRKWREFSWPQSEGQAWNSVFIGHTFLYVYAATNLMSQGNEAIDDLCWKPSLSEYKVRIELVVYSRHCNGGLQIFLEPKVVHYRLQKKDKTKLSCLVSILEFMDLMWRWRTEIWYLLRAVFPILLPWPNCCVQGCRYQKYVILVDRYALATQHMIKISICGISLYLHSSLPVQQML